MSLTFRTLIHSKRLWIAITLIVLIALYFLNPADYAFSPKCPFKLLTGLNCPGCGLQRATYALLHGHIREAWSYNPFLFCVTPWVLIVIHTEWFCKDEQKIRLRRIFEGKVIIYIYILFYLLWGIVRNILEI